MRNAPSFFFLGGRRQHAHKAGAPPNSCARSTPLLVSKVTYEPTVRNLGTRILPHQRWELRPRATFALILASHYTHTTTRPRRLPLPYCDYVEKKLPSQNRRLRSRSEKLRGPPKNSFVLSRRDMQIATGQQTTQSFSQRNEVGTGYERDCSQNAHIPQEKVGALAHETHSEIIKNAILREHREPQVRI